MKKLKQDHSLINFYLISLLVSSILTSITFKIQQSCVVDGVSFNHPLMQTTLMFFAEALCYVGFVFYKWRYKERYEQDREYQTEKLGKKLKINKFLFAIPSLFDMVGTLLTLTAMQIMPFSFYYMTRGGNVTITAIFSQIFLKRVLYKHSFIGLLLNFIGFLTVGISAIINSETDEDSTYLIFGVVLIIVTYFTTTCQLVIQEKLFKTYFLHSLEAVGWEGFWGILYSIVFLAIFSNIPCPEFIHECSNGKIEDIPGFFQMIFNTKGSDQPLLLIMIGIGFICVLLLNGFSFAVTKHVGCLSRSVILCVSPFIVWMLAISIGWDKFNYGQFCGYLIISIGTMIYSEIIVIPFWGLNDNVKSNIDKRSPLQQLTQISPKFPMSSAKSCQFNITCQAINSESCKIT